MEEVKEKPRKPGTFVKGDPRIAPLQARARVAAGIVEPGREVRKPVEEARDPVLTAYRHVLDNPDAKLDRSGLEKLARRNHDENPREFEKRYRELEAEERSGGPGAVVVGEDASEDRVVELLRKALEEVSGE